MATCLVYTLNASGVYVIRPCNQNTPIDQQQIINTVTENNLITSVVNRLADTPNILDIFGQPIAADMQQAFYMGFALPVICYLVSWGYQSVINFIKE